MLLICLQCSSSKINWENGNEVGIHLVVNRKQWFSVVSLSLWVSLSHTTFSHISRKCQTICRNDNELVSSNIRCNIYICKCTCNVLCFSILIEMRMFVPVIVTASHRQFWGKINKNYRHLFDISVSHSPNTNTHTKPNENGGRLTLGLFVNVEVTVCCISIFHYQSFQGIFMRLFEVLL